MIPLVLRPQLLLCWLWLALLGGGMVSAQAPALIDQYPFNGLVLNPASSGSREVLHAALMGRNQWMGFGNSPFLGTFTLDGIDRSRRNGFGIVGSVARRGPLLQNHFSGTYAYRLPLRYGKLAFGLSGGFSTLQLKSAEVATTDPGDAEFLENSPVLLAPEAGFGVWYETQRFYLGFSAPQLLGYYSDRYDLYAGGAGRTRYFLGTGGVLIPIADQVKLKPTFLLKYLPVQGSQLDLNLFVILADKVWLGAGYRTTGDWVFLGQFQLNQQLQLGYAYGWSTAALRPWNSGSHSLVLGYDFGYQVKTERPVYYW